MIQDNHIAQDLRDFNATINPALKRSYGYYVRIFNSLRDDNPINIISLAHAYECVLSIYSEHVFDHESYYYLSNALYKYAGMECPKLDFADKSRPLMFNDLNLRKEVLDKISSVLHSYFSNNKAKLVDFIMTAGCDDFVILSGVFELLKDYEFENQYIRHDFMNILTNYVFNSEPEDMDSQSDKIPEHIFQACRDRVEILEDMYAPICLGPGENKGRYNVIVSMAYDLIIRYE